MNRRDCLKAGAAGMTVWAAPLRGVAASAQTQPESRPESPAITKPIPKPVAGGATALPVIGLGTWQTFDVGTEPERANLGRLLRKFAARGGRVIDSSPMYGRSEEVAGSLIAAAHLRAALFVATKVWIRGRDAGIAQMNDSMRKLGADPIDLMQVHNLLDIDTHLATLAEWKKAGRVRHVGITHYTEGAYAEVEKALERHAVDFLQINYSIGERAAERRLLPMARERGIAVIANRPFAGGALFRRLRAQPLPDWAAQIGCDSWAQLMLKFVVSHPAVTCAIPATSKLEHLTDNLRAGVGLLPDAAMRARIAALA